MTSKITLKRTIYKSYLSSILIILATIYAVLIFVFFNFEFRRIRSEINKTAFFIKKELEEVKTLNLTDQAIEQIISLKIDNFNKIQEAEPLKSLKITYNNKVYSTSHAYLFYPHNEKLGEFKSFYSQQNIIVIKNILIPFGDKNMYLQIYSEEIRGDLGPLFRSLLVSLIFIVLAALLALRRIKKLVQQPISEITKAVKKINRYDLSQRIHIINPNNELGQISITINEMIGRLEVSFNSQNNFISNASHELRTPLAVIKGYADLLEAGAKVDPKMVDHGIKEILKEVKNMENLLKQLLFLARKENETLKNKIEPFQISDLISELIEKQQLVDKNHIYTIIKNDSAIINLDKTLLLQALRELLKNSSKYTPDGGNISIESFIKKDSYHIIIRDTGKGIPEKNLKFIFERFYIQDDSRNRQKNSFGLGLSIVKDIVKLHDGKISVKSKVDKGTSIFIEFPDSVQKTKKIRS
ncbi:MAG: HAMP domain-containing protein [Psychrilyobacter sp.]|nr:HAMP domain-containing protein [Psychrilyobacter sp.]